MPQCIPLGLPPSALRTPGGQPSRSRSWSARRIARSLGVSRWLRYANSLQWRHMRRRDRREVPPRAGRSPWLGIATRRAGRQSRTPSCPAAPRSASTPNRRRIHRGCGSRAQLCRLHLQVDRRCGFAVALPQPGKAPSSCQQARAVDLTHVERQHVVGAASTAMSSTADAAHGPCPQRLTEIIQEMAETPVVLFRRRCLVGSCCRQTLF